MKLPSIISTILLLPLVLAQNGNKLFTPAPVLVCPAGETSLSVSFDPSPREGENGPGQVWIRLADACSGGILLSDIVYSEMGNQRLDVGCVAESAWYHLALSPSVERDGDIFPLYIYSVDFGSSFGLKGVLRESQDQVYFGDASLSFPC